MNLELEQVIWLTFQRMNFREQELRKGKAEKSMKQTGEEAMMT